MMKLKPARAIEPEDMIRLPHEDGTVVITHVYQDGDETTFDYVTETGDRKSTATAATELVEVL